MHALEFFVLAISALGGPVVAVFDLNSCQDRCYTMTAKLIDCGEEDYACHCTRWDSQFAPQWTSCQIEGCAFNSPGITTEQLKELVCNRASGADNGDENGDSPSATHTSPPIIPSPGPADPSAPPSVTGSSQSPSSNADDASTSSGPSTTVATLNAPSPSATTSESGASGSGSLSPSSTNGGAGTDQPSGGSRLLPGIAGVLGAIAVFM